MARCRNSLLVALLESHVRSSSTRAGALLVLVALAVPASAAAAGPANPCLDAAARQRLLCPDLVMRKPFGLALDPVVRPGRVVLRAGNSIDNVGLGPAELHGVRTSRTLMRARQRVYRRRGGRIGIGTGARLFFKHVPGQASYWKFLYAARFELWRLDSAGRRIRRVRTGPKVAYCLRDLSHRFPSRRGSPPRRVYPACSQNFRRSSVVLGTSVGWSDVYPSPYPEQLIDVTGLRGCFDYVHIADPENGIFESNEDNNEAETVVRLPFTGSNRGCRSRPPNEPPPPAQYGY